MDLSISTSRDWLLTARIPNIIQGENTTLAFQVLDRQSQSLVNISAATEIEVVLPATGEPLKLKLSAHQITIVDGPSGKFSLALLPDDTENLQVGMAQITVYLTIGGLLTILNLEDAYNVESPILQA